MKDLEGTATVMEVHKQSNMESAYVGVVFADTDLYEGEQFDRWILPQHILGGWAGHAAHKEQP